ncbi:hypothetical protein ACLG6S_05130 [Thermodesulfobacteriota bacterium B35]
MVVEAGAGMGVNFSQYTGLPGQWQTKISENWGQESSSKGKGLKALWENDYYRDIVGCFKIFSHVHTAGMVWWYEWIFRVYGWFSGKLDIICSGNRRDHVEIISNRCVMRFVDVALFLLYFKTDDYQFR